MVDPLKNYFLNNIEEVGLVYVEPIKLVLALRNMRRVDARVARRLDNFLVA
jgi:hypothetical protein